MSRKSAIRCYYDVLEVERTATNDELKRSYRKMALVWHPDKNQHQLEVAEVRFKEINHAYSILSDPNERKWYDDHRDAILRGKDGNAEDTDLNLWVYFSAACFDEYDDGERGFYTVYAKVFADLDNEEVEASDEFSRDARSRARLAPIFGDSKAVYKDVIAFYNYWRSFATKKKFGGSDLYNYTDAPNRYIKRLMEKENTKERSKARTEYNEQVRHLAEYIYLRDPRISEYLRLQRELEEIKRQKEEDQRLIDEENHREMVKKHREERRLEFEKAKAEGGYKYMEAEETIEDIPEFSCIVCDKMFKSERQLKNHENSNKHKQALQKMKRQVSMDGEIDFDDDEPIIEDDEVEEEEEDIKSKDKSKKKKIEIKQEEEEDVKSKDKKKKSTPKKKSKVKEIDLDEFETLGMVSKKKKDKKKKKQIIESEEEEEEEEEVEEREEEEDQDDEEEEKPKKKDKKKKILIVEDSEEEQDKKPTKDKKKKKSKKNKKVDDSSDDDLPSNIVSKKKSKVVTRRRGK